MIQLIFNSGVLVTLSEYNNEQTLTFACAADLRFDRQQQVRALWTVICETCSAVNDLQGSVTILEDYEDHPEYCGEMDIVYVFDAHIENLQGPQNLRDAFFIRYEGEFSIC